MKSTAMNTYRICIGLLLIAVVYGVSTTPVQAQDQLPFREYVNPDEVITFDRSTSFIEAIEIINQFVQEYENKFLVDKSNYTGAIGVTLPPMHWRDALRYILQFRNLELVTTDEYYEIRVPVATPQQTTGTVTQPAANAAQAGAPVSLLADKGTREVRINATFFEGNRRVLEEIGIDWSTLTSNVPANVADYVTAEGAGTIPETAFTDQFVSVNASNASQVSQNVFNALVNFGQVGPVNVQALFSAFEANNVGQTLATPSIKVVDGVEGRIQVGQDFSVKQRDFAGNVTDVFISTGTILTVTPTIIEDNDTTFIHLDIEVERSSAQPDVVSTIINKQSAETQTLLLNGEATAIAGLYQTDESTVRRGVPILKDLPGWFFGLRYLFGYNSDNYVENELVILIQAELEKSLDQRIQEKLKTKGDVLAEERDRFLNDMDYIIDQAESGLPVSPPVDTTSSKDQLDDGRRELRPKKNTTETVYIPTTPDTAAVVDTTQTTEDLTEDLTEEQQKEADDLSMPVTNPELMVVVPKAFDLEEYLKRQEEGNLAPAEEDQGIRFFVIGGSFIVPDNAYRFENMLDEEGFNSRILYNPTNRFNYVAYYGFDNFDEAVAMTRRLQVEINPEIWMFTMQSNTVDKSPE